MEGLCLDWCTVLLFCLWTFFDPSMTFRMLCCSKIEEDVQNRPYALKVKLRITFCSFNLCPMWSTVIKEWKLIGFADFKWETTLCISTTMCSYNVLHYCNVWHRQSALLAEWSSVGVGQVNLLLSFLKYTNTFTHIHKAPYKRSPSWTDTCTCTHSLQLQFVPICTRRWEGGQSDTDGWTAAWTESKDNKWREGRNELTVKCIHYSYRNKCLVRNWWHHHQSASRALLFPSHRWALAAPCISLRCV